GPRTGIRLRRLQKEMTRLRCLLLFIIVLGSQSCTSPDIYQDPSFNPPVRWGFHRVQPGDSLYSIAWRYGRDFRELAAENKIPDPYKVYPEQLITLEGTGAWKPSSTTSSSPPGQASVKKPPQKPVSNPGNKKT